MIEFEGNEPRTTNHEPIAIVGIGLRFPGGSDTPEKFWDFLMKNQDAISEISNERWSSDRFYTKDANVKGKSKINKGGFLTEDLKAFDNSFFGISPRESSMMDPQQKILLEICYEAFEDAGIKPKDLEKTRTGVFIGGFTSDWKILQFKESNRYLIDAHSATGAMMTLLSNRISYVFDLQGPSVSVDTACSASLTAVHLACQSIWTGDSTLAIAGGVNLSFVPEYFIAESKAGMLSPNGLSKTYDADADGYVRGEGAGIILLKPLKEAEKDGDKIYAVIRGTGCNQDGKTSGITVPNGDSQQNLMRAVYEKSGISPHEIDYIEAHGTGTPVGDPIEANAIGAVLGVGRNKEEPCYISSVKTYIGHLEAAAGIAGLIKTVISMNKSMFPKHLHLKSINPKINFDEMNLKLPLENTPWVTKKSTKKAAVNSFGFGGSNAHVVIEEYVPKSNSIEEIKRTKELDKLICVPISAKSNIALEKLIGKMTYENEQYQDFAQLGSHFATKREHYNHRATIIATNQEEWLEKLKKLSDGQITNDINKGKIESEKNELVMVFTGMGPQWWAMGHELYKSNQIFRETLDEIDTIYKSYSRWSLLEQLLADEENSKMNETYVAQPSNFAIQIGLFNIFKSYGILPNKIVGHSAGEPAAAYAAGVFNLEDAVKITYVRSTLQQATAGKGKMLAVSLSKQEYDKLIISYDSNLVSIAAINSPSSLTLTGDEKVLSDIALELEQKGVFQKFLQVNVPYHSHYMSPFEKRLLEELRNINPKKTTTILYSTVLGNIIDGETMSAEYWWNNVRGSVFFADACNNILRDGGNIFLEIGPHPVLSSSIIECANNVNMTCKTLHSLNRKVSEEKSVLRTLSDLYILGFDINWKSMYIPVVAKNFPVYTWDKQVNWQESKSSILYRTEIDIHPLLGSRTSSSLYEWENDIDISKASYLLDHKIQNSVVFPGAGYIEMCLAAITQIYGDDYFLRIESVNFKKAMFLTNDVYIKTNSTYDPVIGVFKVFSKKFEYGNETDWILNAEIKVYPINYVQKEQVDIENLKNMYTERYSKEECYKTFEQLGLIYGNTFRGIDYVLKKENEVFAKFDLKISSQDLKGYKFHPTILDTLFQALAFSLPFDENSNEKKVYMPVSILSSTMIGNPNEASYIHAKITKKTNRELFGDISLFDKEGNVLFKIIGCRAIELTEENKTYVKNQDLVKMSWNLYEEKEEHEILDMSENIHTDTWVIFADKHGFSENMKGKLLEKGNHCIYVTRDTKYSFLENKVTIDAENIEHYKILFKEIQSKKINLVGVCFCWSIDMTDTNELTYEILIGETNLGVHALLYLVQTLNEIKWDRYPKVWTITNKSQQVLENCKKTNIAQTSLWGFSRVMGHWEHLDLHGGIIDIDLSEGEENYNLVLKAIFEIPKKYDQIAIRNNKIYIGSIKVISEPKYTIPIVLEPCYAYLITGGFGALGTLTSKWLIEKGVRHLILTSRESLPKRKEWRNIDLSSSVRSKIETVIELEKMGANVYVAKIDLESKDEINSFIMEYEEQLLPEIKGIFHLAGFAKPQRISEMSKEDFDKVLMPKMLGSWNLHQAFKNKNLDYFILYSSISSVISLAGQGNYAAANAFMDGLAGYRRSIGLAGQSINWGPWAEVGMATQLNLETYFLKMGFYPMLPEQGLEALERVITYNDFQTGVIAADWNIVANLHSLGQYPNMLENLLVHYTKDNDSFSSKRTEVSYKELLRNEKDIKKQKDIILDYTRNITRFVLRLEESDMADDIPLTSWGLDSMMAVELKNQIEKDLKVELEVVMLLQGPTVKNLSEEIFANFIFDEDIVTSENILLELKNQSEENDIDTLVALTKEE